ncbi:MULTISPECIES: hypothetical protein [Agrobacterium]|uniref:hypothetical protein n=1 Tax=Agrobacterium tumefaciens TaxID=358 RepID=UPI001572A302|nr:hypothetical protein [Agrobacterium tumefaciens]
MADRPILFSAPMIRALLAGKKTQTRRLFKGIERLPVGTFHVFGNGGGIVGVCEEDVPTHAPDYANIQTGDRLWVRETWQGLTFGDFRPTKHEPCEVRYAATDPCADLDAEARGYQWRPSIFMPRFASRLTLAVIDVRVERLQNISHEDALAEGIIQLDRKAWIGGGPLYGLHEGEGHDTATGAYNRLWRDINGDRSWAANPWVVVYDFTVHHGNIDQIAQVAA